MQPPRLFFVTDPARTPDPVATARRLPPGCAVIYRSFGAPKALETARTLAAVCRARRLVLLIGADPKLAAACGARGVHLPERTLHLGLRLRGARPDWLITGAAHSVPALRRAAAAGLDAALLSPAFESRSASAGRPFGPVRFAALCREAGLPVIALGGINAGNTLRILGAGAHGIAAVDGFVEDSEGLARALPRGRQNWKAVSRWTRGRAS